MTMTTDSPTTSAEELAQAERDLAAVAKAIADLYDTPAKGADAYRTQEQTREALETRLDSLRARVLELHLAASVRAYAEVGAALEHWQVELRTAEQELQAAHQRVATARARVDELRAQERLVRDQRQGLRHRLTVSIGQPRHTGDNSG